MTERESCRKCEFETDLKGCALKHIQEARKLLASGDYDGVDKQLSSVEAHLREQ